MSEPLRISVCGAGAWGTAMALHCEGRGHITSLVSRRPEHADALLAAAENEDYLPGYRFGEGLNVTANLEVGLKGADVVFLAAPSYALREWCERIRQLPTSLTGSETLFVSLAKGLELETRKTPSGIVGEEMPGAVVGSLSGPTYASEVAAEKPTAMTLAFGADCPDGLVERLQNAVSGPNLRIYASRDLRGVELGGCLKNVYAVAAGCCQGLGLGDNAHASLLTRAVAEMVRVGQALGANAETFYGSSGFGDLVATCHGHWSRNRTFGEAIARGKAASEIIAGQKTAVEGYRTAKAFRAECQSKGIDAPILEQVYLICYESKPPVQALSDLMSRDLKRE